MERTQRLFCRDLDSLDEWGGYHFPPSEYPNRALDRQMDLTAKPWALRLNQLEDLGTRTPSLDIQLREKEEHNIY